MSDASPRSTGVETPRHGDDLSPSITSGEIDAAQLDRLEQDLLGEAEVRSVRLKGDPNAHASASPSLTDAFTLLRHGGVHAIQIRYRFDGGAWFDTITSGDSGWRLVRAPMPARPANSTTNASRPPQRPQIHDADR